MSDDECAFYKKIIESDIATRNVVREISKECRNVPDKDVEKFVIFFVNLLQLDPSWGITQDFLMNRLKVQKFVRHCVDAIKRHNCPPMVTLRMQMLFMYCFSAKEEMASKNRSSLQERLAPLEKEIVQTPDINNEEDKEKFYKKIVYFTTLLSGLGNPTLPNVYREALAALQSVFGDDEIEEFLSFKKGAKMDQLVELTELCTGIRLFNRDCNKGGEGIEDLPKMLVQAIETIQADLQKVLAFVMERVNFLTSALENCYKVRKTHTDNPYHLYPRIPEGAKKEDVEYYKDLLVLYRQYEIYVKKIINEVKEIEVQSEKDFEDFQEVLKQVHKTIGYRTVIPTLLVFPLFEQISSIWCSLQDKSIVLAKFDQLIINLQNLATQLRIDDEILRVMIGTKVPLTDEQRRERTVDLRIIWASSEMEIEGPENFDDLDAVPLRFHGFDPWKMVESEGGLFPGSANMGVACIDEYQYAFSCPESAKTFSKHPKRYLMEILTLARRKVELISYLEVYDDLLEVRKVERLFKKPPEIIKHFDMEAQTDLHPIPVKIDPSYKWNIWDYKREALRFANMSKCKTKQTQTNKVSGKKYVKTQTYEIRTKEIQTKRDNYSNVPRPLNYIYGLRGRKDDKQFIIELTRPVKE